MLAHELLAVCLLEFLSEVEIAQGAAVGRGKLRVAHGLLAVIVPVSCGLRRHLAELVAVVDMSLLRQVLVAAPVARSAVSSGPEAHVQQQCLRLHLAEYLIPAGANGPSLLAVHLLVVILLA